MWGTARSLYAFGLAVALATTMAPRITEAGGHGGSGHSGHVGAVAITQIPINRSSPPAIHSGFAPAHARPAFAPLYARPGFHARPVFRHRRYFGGDDVGFFVPYVIEPHIITVTSGSGTNATGIAPAASQSRPVIERFPRIQPPKGSILLVRGSSVSFVLF
jgi:hypothetical protein